MLVAVNKTGSDIYHLHPFLEKKSAETGPEIYLNSSNKAWPNCSPCQFKTTRMLLKQPQCVKDPISNATDKKYQTTYSH